MEVYLQITGLDMHRMHDVAGIRMRALYISPARAYDYRLA
jgi:hypothetical protein